jgi:hypothetical protein
MEVTTDVIATLTIDVNLTRYKTTLAGDEGGACVKKRREYYTQRSNGYAIDSR